MFSLHPQKTEQTLAGCVAWPGKQGGTESRKARVPAQIVFLISWVTLRKSLKLSELSLCISSTDENSLFSVPLTLGQESAGTRGLRKCLLWTLT